MNSTAKFLLFLIGLFISISFLFTSCKKDYTCNCTYKSVDTIFPHNKISKKVAENYCSETENNLKDSDATSTCSLNIAN